MERACNNVNSVNSLSAGQKRALSAARELEEIAIVTINHQTDKKRPCEYVEFVEYYETMVKKQKIDHTEVPDPELSWTNVSNERLEDGEPLEYKLNGEEEKDSTSRWNVFEKNDNKHFQGENMPVTNIAVTESEVDNVTINAARQIDTISHVEVKDTAGNEGDYSVWKCVSFPEQPNVSDVSHPSSNSQQRDERVAEARGRIIQRLNRALEDNFLLKYSSIVMNLIKEAFVLSVRLRENANLTHVDPINTILTCKNFNLAAWTVLYVISTTSMVAGGLDRRPLMECANTNIWRRTAKEIRCVASYIATGRGQFGKFLQWARSKYSSVDQIHDQSEAMTTDAPRLEPTPGSDAIDEVLSMAANMMFFSSLSSRKDENSFTEEEKIVIFKIGSLVTLLHYLKCKREGIPLITPLRLELIHTKLAETLAHVVLAVYSKVEGSAKKKGVQKISTILDSYPVEEITKHAFPAALCHLLILFTKLMKIKTAGVIPFLSKFQRTNNVDCSTAVGQSTAHLQQTPCSSGQKSNEPLASNTEIITHNDLMDLFEVVQNQSHISREYQVDNDTTSCRPDYCSLPVVDQCDTRSHDADDTGRVGNRMETDIHGGSRTTQDLSNTGLSSSFINNFYQDTSGHNQMCNRAVTREQSVTLPYCDNSMQLQPQTVLNQSPPVYISTFVQMLGTNITVTQLPSTSSGTVPQAGCGSTPANTSPRGSNISTRLTNTNIAGFISGTAASSANYCDAPNCSKGQTFKATDAPKCSVQQHADRKELVQDVPSFPRSQPTVIHAADENSASYSEDNVFTDSCRQEYSKVPGADDSAASRPQVQSQPESTNSPDYFTNKLSNSHNAAETKDILEEFFEMYELPDSPNSYNQASFENEICNKGSSETETAGLDSKPGQPDIICISDDEEP